MAYDKKSGGGCTPITAKIKRVTRGGMTVTQPALNMGAPVSMKHGMPDGSPNKMFRLEKAKQVVKGPEVYNMKAKDAAGAAAKTSSYDKMFKDVGGKLVSGFTPGTMGKATKLPGYSTVEVGGKKTGTIHKRKVSYDKAYQNRDRKLYGDMTKAQFIKESKRQTKSFEETGSFDIPKAKKLTAVVASPKPTTIKPTASVDIKVTKKVKPTKKQTRKTKSVDKKLAKAKVARAAGDIKKAERKEKRATKKMARVQKRVAEETRLSNTSKPKRRKVLI